MSARGTLLKFSPLLAPFLLLFVGGLALAVAQSFGLWLPFPYEGGRLDAYRALLQPYLLASIGFSVYVALASAAASVGIGAVLSYGVWRLPRRLETAAVVYKVPLILPHIAVAFIILVFWTKSGFVASVGHHLGLVDTPADFPSVLYSGNGLGMILAYVYKEVPFVVILCHAALKRLDPRLVQTAHMFGARETHVFRAAVLPHLRNSLHTAFLILFLYTFGAFDIPFLLGESTPGMLSIEVYNLYFRKQLADRPTAMAVLVLMLLFSAVFIVLYTKVAARLSSRERKL